MKVILFISLIFFGFSSLAQNSKLLEDSLTGKTQQTWVDCDSRYKKQIGNNCIGGAEYIFYKKDRKGIRKRCVNGVWVENKFTWIVEAIDNSYFIRTKNNESNDRDEFQIQVMNENNRLQTRLTFNNYSMKAFTRYCKKK